MTSDVAISSERPRRSAFVGSIVRGASDGVTSDDDVMLSSGGMQIISPLFGKR